MTERDFYLDEHALAAYAEKDWFDHVVKTGHARPNRFAFAPFDLLDLYSPYHERFADLVARGVLAERPQRMLEIGSSTGRTFYELVRRLDTITRAVLIEPSRHLHDVFAKLFGISESSRSHEYLPVLKGNGDLTEVLMDTTPLKHARARVDLNLLNLGFAEAPDDLGEFDLVVCSNVVDQCHHPLRLIELLKRSTRVGGFVAVSCTYQWQAKYRGLPTDPIRHLDQLFGEPWQAVTEANVPFQVRVNERHWMTFLSHVVLFRRQG